MPLKFSTHTSPSLHQIKTPALAVGVFAEGELPPAAELINHASHDTLRTLAQSEFRARLGDTLVLHALPGISAQRVVLVGLGKQEAYNARALADAQCAFTAYCVKAQLTEAASTLVSLPIADTSPRARARLALIATHQALYCYDATLGKPEVDPHPKLKAMHYYVGEEDAASVQAGLQEGFAIAQGIEFARHLGDLPSNHCTPTYLSKAATQLAETYKTIKVQVLDAKQIDALGMHSFLSVARGSDEPPRFIVLHYRAKPPHKGEKHHTAPIVLVGKGITFDSGGISLKPPAAMDEMKYDMCGAASVLGTLQAVAALALPLEIIGLIPTCENLPSGKANKPGDVVTSLSGQTIEVLNTDAEGRLILCDALTYAERFNPVAVIDIATLTGSCVVALGHVHSGLFSADDTLAEALLQAGRESLDTAWRMPLDEAYQESLKSNFADIANIGGPAAGSVTAACFLSRFTRAYPWLHLDIAGTAWRKGKEKGATGRPVGLLMHYLLKQAAAHSGENLA